jgi:hypothetical protein
LIIIETNEIETKLIKLNPYIVLKELKRKIETKIICLFLANLSNMLYLLKWKYYYVYDGWSLTERW